MNSDTVMGLVNNAALLLALAVLYDAFPLSKKPRRWTQEILTGVLLGLIGMAIMLTPWRFSAGIIFDTRSVLLSLTGLFFGILSTVIAVLMTITLRIYQGGAGAVMGVSVILTSAGLGLLWRYFLRLKNKTPRWFEFYGFGILVHLAMLLATLLLPRAIIIDVLKNIWLPVMLIYPLGTVLLGSLLIRQHQRNQWEQELRQERDLLACISETSPVGITTTDRNGQITYANARAEEILGLSRNEISQRAYNAPDWKITSLEGGPFPEAQLPFRQVMDKKETVLNVLHAIEWPEGRRVLLSINAAPLMDAHGQVDGMVASLENITVRKRAEEALQKSEQQYRLLFDEMLSGFAIHEIICDPAGKPVDYRFLAINPAFEKMTGLNSEAILGKTVLEVLPGTESTWIERYGQVALTREPTHFENYAEDLGKYFEVRAYSPELGKFATIFYDITERKLAEEKIRASLAEKELLLKEIHHRVKNNLQIIISLIRLQARSIEDAAALKAFEESIHRVHSMSQVHEQLYSSNDLARILFRSYVDIIANHLVRSYNMSSRVSLDLNIQNIALGIDTAIPCGLLLNELLTNSLKYAFPDSRKGVIKISMRLTESNHYELMFRDDGIGLGGRTDLNETESFGMKLIKMLTEQIHGKLVLMGDEGTCYKITFPKDQK